MPDRYYLSQLEQWAASAWKRLSLDPPCDLQAVCDFLRIRVERRIFPNDLHGAYIRLPDGSQGIKLNSGLPITKQRFVWAHEIGHALLLRHRPDITFMQYGKNRYHAHERQCNRFAAFLLMPESQVRAAAEELGHPKEDKAFILAEKFGVSPAAMRRRLREFRLEYAEPPR